jgi:hypothetical protein
MKGVARHSAGPTLAGEKHQKQPEELDGSNLSIFIMILGILPHLELSGFMNLS